MLRRAAAPAAQQQASTPACSGPAAGPRCLPASGSSSSGGGLPVRTSSSARRARAAAAAAGQQQQDVSTGVQPEQVQTQQPVYAYPYPPGAPYEADLGVAQAVEPSSSTALYAPPAGYPPPYAQYGARSPQEMQYMVAPYGYPPPPPREESSGAGGLPWWLLLGAGVVLGGVASKVSEFMKNPKSPQQMMTEMAMKQMMGAMGGPGGKPGGMPPGFPPMPGAAGGMPPGFPGMPPGFPPAGAAAAPGTTVDVPPSADRKGDRFNSRRSSGGADDGSSSSSSNSPIGSSSSDSSAGAAGVSGRPEPIEPIVKEPASSSSASASSSAPRSASSFFASATAEDVAKGNAKFDNGATGQAAGGQAGGEGGEAGDGGATMSQMMEQMMRDPEMQKMLYPYLPEPMRNPTSIEWMLNNPEVKKQMSEMFESQNMMSPQMMEMMKGMDFNQEKVNQQFQELGLKPEDVISKVMADPELAQGFSNPRVQAAIMEISQNPMNIVKYQNEPEIMSVLNKVTGVFGQGPPSP